MGYDDQVLVLQFLDQNGQMVRSIPFLRAKALAASIRTDGEESFKALPRATSAFSLSFPLCAEPDRSPVAPRVRFGIED